MSGTCGRRAGTRPLRVMVDAHMVGRRETGNETYVVGLLSGLACLPDVRVAAVVSPDTPLPPEVTSDGIEVLPLRSPSNWARVGWRLARLSDVWKPDVLHSTYIAPWRCRCPLVLTVHDVSFRRFPKFFSARDRLLFATFLPSSLRRAAVVLTISRHSRREITHFYPRLRTPVRSVALGVGREFRPVADESRLREIRRRYDTGTTFILAVGNLQPRKNLAGLVRAFRRVRERTPDVRLVIAGQAQGRTSPLFELVRSLDLSDRVVFPGYVPREDLPGLYSAARLFVYPSTYEGFGLPILEAMACGTPVVAVDTASIPEVAGDAALLTKTPGAGDLATAILRVLEDATLARELARRGLRRAERFSWERTAQQTVAAYQEITQA